MIIQKDFLNKLKDFDVNSYEAKLWTALLSRGVATAGELSDIANVPRSRSYDVLESLERKGFVIMKLGKPIKYIAVPPAEVIDRVKKRIHEDADKQSKIIEGLKNSEVLNELNILHKEGMNIIDPSDITGAVKGRDNLYNHIATLIKNAEKYVLLVTTEQGLNRKAETLKNALQKAKDKNVKIKIIAPQTKNNINAVKTLSKYGQIKTIPAATTRFCIVDGKQVTFMTLDDEKIHPNYDFGIWVSNESFTKNFENLFNKLWD